MSNNSKGLTDRQKSLMGYWAAVITFVICALGLIAANFAVDGLFWFFVIFNFLSGPLCLFFYLREVRRGVFAIENDENYDEEDL